MHNQKMPIPQNAFFMHPSMQMHPQNQIGAKPGQNIPRVNMNPNNSYMPSPHSMMMNQPPMYYNNMMHYGMPPPIRNEGTSTGDEKSKERANYPMYYQTNSWNPYMMNPHSMMRP
jgi:hypothetical protein